MYVRCDVLLPARPNRTYPSAQDAQGASGTGPSAGVDAVGAEDVAAAVLELVALGVSLLVAGASVVVALSVVAAPAVTEPFDDATSGDGAGLHAGRTSSAAPGSPVVFITSDDTQPRGRMHRKRKA